MESIPVLVTPLEYPLDEENVERCYNCGSNLFRVREIWGILKEDFVKANEDEYPCRLTVVDINYHCAVCGKEQGGHFLAPPDEVERQFDTQCEAEEYFHNLPEKPNEPSLIAEK